jgi:perosamine synthetase
MKYSNLVDVITVAKNKTLRQALRAIEAGGLGVVFIVDPYSRKFIGLMTDGDVRRALIAGKGLETDLAEIQLEKPITAKIGIQQNQIFDLFTESVRVIPILDGCEKVVDIAVYDRRSHIPVAQPLIGESELVNVTECILSGWISSTGRFVTLFESRCSEYLRVPHAISTSNGTTALHLALVGLSIGLGDEVIVPTLTFIASANAVAYTGAVPVFVDSEPGSWNLDPVCVERAITSRTKAVMAVHLYGHPADMNSLRDICNRYNLFLIEDAAEAFGATYNGASVGTVSDVATFSFFGNKIITTGEGGMLVTSDSKLAEKCRILRDHGMSPSRRYWHTMLGFNYRITNLQAAVGCAQIEKIDAIIAAKRKIAELYKAELKHVPGINFPKELSSTQSVYWLNSFTLDPILAGVDRNFIMNSLKNNHIETRVVFPVLHKQPIYSENEHQPMPVAERISDLGLSLPSDPTLSVDEVKRIASLIREAVEQ